MRQHGTRGVTAIILATALSVLSACQHTKQALPAVSPEHDTGAVRGTHVVTDYGAVGDGGQDCTRAFQAALDAAGADGGGLVIVPTGRYHFSGTLVMPPNVTLEGVWRAPQRGEPYDAGSVLYVTAGQGDADGTPFLRMSTGATLKGLTLFYPEQIRANPPHAYPWTVQSNGATDNISIRDVTMINPYQAVDLGSYPAGRHFVSNLYAYPLRLGLYINQCYDVGRIENVHFWPFWDLDPQSPLWAFTKEHGTAFLIGKTDGQMGHNLFSIFYRYGMRFIAGPIYDEERNIIDHQAGSGMYTNCYMDVSPCAIRVDAAMEKAGISFVNASIMSRVEVGPKNRGQVKFTGSGFWATGDLEEHAVLEGRGTVFFDACHFNDWDRAGKGVPCIDANNQRVIVTGCEFPTHRDDHLVLRIGPRVRSAVITSNLMPGGKHIENNAHETADIQIAHNATEPSPNFLTKWLVLGPFPNHTLDTPDAEGATRYGHNRDFLVALGGEARARLETDTTVTYTDVRGNEQEATTQLLRGDTRGFMNMFELYRRGYQVAYAFTWLYSPTDQQAWFDMGMNDGGKVFVNGEQVYERFSPRGRQCVPGTDLFRADLVSGWNPVLVKLEDGGGRRWEFVFEAYGEDGAPLTGHAHGADCS